MNDRSAVDTIRGYFYQFDLSILSILSLPSPDDSIEIECVEDIDINSANEITAVQCKYYEKTEYNHSVVKDAVKYMVSHFKESLLGAKPSIRYLINGHYASGHEKLPETIDVKFLKENFLTYSQGKGDAKVTRYHYSELDLSDADLEIFLTKFKINIKAESFENQYKKTLTSISAEFKSKPVSTEYFYYSNALAVIRDLSTKSDLKSRSITKKAFLERIDISSVLFSEWFLQIKGKKAHLAAIRTEHFAHLNTSPFERFFLIEVDNAPYVRADVKELIKVISRKWSKLKHNEPSPFCPYFYLHRLPDNELLELKKELRAEDFHIIDGHDFHGSDFNHQSITKTATHGNGIKAKILNSPSNISQVVDYVSKTRKIYQFYLGDRFFDYENPAVRHIKIQVERMSDIISII